LSRSDLPLWARAVAAGLLLAASWWLLRTAAVVTAVGSSVVLVGLGVVAASMLRGMNVPLGFWPSGPWRRRFLPRAALGPAGVIAAAVLLAAPARDPALVDLVDPGVYLLVAAGAVAWGLGTGLVTLRPFLPWMGLAVVLALAPTLATMPFGGVQSGFTSEVCWLQLLESPTGAGCRIAYPWTVLFLAVVIAPAALVSHELAFRRVFLGVDGSAGVLAVLAAAGVAAAWAYLVGDQVVLAPDTWWLGASAAASAGSLYVLSRSVVVSATYTGLVLAGTAAVSFAAMDPDATLGGLAVAGRATMAHAAVALGLLVMVGRRNGIFAGLR